ncbi:sel1 repeat family protein, partial [Variovorax sp. 2RAF20]
DKAPDIARKMQRCAAEQGHGEAAGSLGIHLQNKGVYADAIQTYQMGVRAGNALSASFLEEGFRGPPESDMYYLGAAPDIERSER